MVGDEGGAVGVEGRYPVEAGSVATRGGRGVVVGRHCGCEGAWGILEDEM